LLFVKKQKKNQNKEEKIIVFCWLSTSLAFFLFQSWRKKFFTFFYKRRALWCFGVKNSRVLHFDRGRKKEKK